ncbi:hypothetical protein N9Z67_03035, partial [Rhodopirellula sp.]|nr:hypothetical protein [Rhodopirellula sp.]
VRRQALDSIRSRETARCHGRAIAPGFHEEIAKTFCEDGSPASLVQELATATHKHVKEQPQEKIKS